MIPSGFALTTPEQIEAFRVRTIVLAMDAYLRSNGRMMLTRTATPAAMRQWASEYTGVTYPRSRKGLQAARTDLVTLLLAAGWAPIRTPA